MPKGQNTYVSEEGDLLLAATDGRIIYKNQRLEILPVLEIYSDANTATGNIKFIGHVIIYGNVLGGFSIEAEGNIEIYGWIEDDKIISKGSI